MRRNQELSSGLLDNRMQFAQDSELPRWRQRRLGFVEQVDTRPVAAILNRRQKALAMRLVVQASPAKAEVLARAQILGGKCWSMPALAEGRLYARNGKGDLVCLDLRPSNR